VKHINFIVRFYHDEERVSKPHVIICHNFDYDNSRSNMSFIRPLSTKWKFLPFPTHTIYASKHLRLVISCTNRHELSCSCCIWFSHILIQASPLVLQKACTWLQGMWTSHAKVVATTPYHWRSCNQNYGRARQHKRPIFSGNESLFGPAQQK
jgi:hypothetical protein